MSGLAGIALEAYSDSTVTEAEDYKAVKKALLARYYPNVEAYRSKFKTAKRKSTDLCTEWTAKICCSFDRWMSADNVQDMTGIKSLSVMKQTEGALP